MRKIFFQICMVLLLASCSSETDSGVLIKTFNVLNENDTRTSIDEDGLVFWCASDEIHYYSRDEGNVRTSVVEKEGGSTVEALKEYGMYDPSRVAFISFDREICRKVAKEHPQFVNQLLDENPLSPVKPSVLADEGINGMDYWSAIFKLKSSYVDDAHNLGMSVNVWTVDDESTAADMVELGVDAITTNDPMMIRDLLKDRELKR